MSELSVMNTVAAGIGVLVAIYAILAVLILLGVYALIRLAVLAKRLKRKPERKECTNCDKLREKSATIVLLEERIRELENKVHELESRPVPEPAPVVVVPTEERTLSESIAVAATTGEKGLISKKSIIAYLSEKYGEAVELNGRPNRTANGKLLLSDNHFAFTPAGKRVCFTYVYETDEGTVVSLIKLDEPYVQGMLTDHPEVRRSAFPKNKAKDWYSVVADATFTEAGYYAVLDHAIELIRDVQMTETPVATVEPVVEPTPEPAPEEPEETVSLSESLAATKEKGAVGVVSKKSIIAHLAAKFGDKVELNGRANRTPNGKLLMSDNHFAFAPDGKRVCFTYIYEDDDGRITILLRTTAAHAKDIRAAHKDTGVKSAFPKNKQRDWYSVIVDESFTEQGVYDELDRAALNIIGAEAVATVVEPTPEEPEETVSLSESLAATKEKGAVGVVSKKSIIEHLGAKFGDKVELNGRANRTPNGKLLMSDNHFAFAPDGKRVCFTYIYEDDDGRITILLRTTAAHAKDIRAAHKDTGVKSAFPKNKERDWYSVIVDESFTEQGVYDELDRAALNIIGAEAVATVVESIPEPAPEEPEETVSLSESLAATKEKGAVGVVSKKSIIEHLGAKFGDKVELNGRANRTPNGKLLMSDNHFAFAPDGKRVCFTYIYEDDDGRITILLRTTAAHAKDIRAAHKDTGVKSAFPKNKERDWYSVIVDESFTEQGVYDELDRAAINIIGTEIAATEVEPIPEPEPAPEEPTEVLPEEKSLKESLADAKVIGAVGIVTKKSIFNHLADRFGDKVELNGRANRTPNGKLLLSDNHFAFAPDGKRVCFTYVYEDDDGRITILLRTDEEHAKIIRSVHPATGLRSAFPKNKEKDWYSMVVDDTFTEKGVYAELDRAALNIIESEPAPAAQEEAPSEEVSLKESLAAAKTVGAVGVVSKKSIIDHLTEKYGDKVEINARENRTPNGKLLLSDNHFALADGKRVCFTYIYEDDGKIVALVRLSDRQAAALHAAHKATGVKSAFPKNKDKDWYSVIVDDTFTDLDVYAVFDESIAYALTK